jgi:hypothetical protein
LNYYLLADGPLTLDDLRDRIVNEQPLATAVFEAAVAELY